MNSILTSVKKMVGIEEAYTHFDPDIVMYINAVLMSINQIGVGPAEGFVITDKNATWESFIGDRKDIEAVKTLVGLKVRLLFDPPSQSVIEAIERMITEQEWRINMQIENTQEEVV